ncbi:MAG: hypothetical protein K940chlam5_01423 [Candidatus Anoxychlamydiales bacterium]|nr:hypothetical protein [Candidatus Anoxychlamydiales bacterium]
MASSFRPLNGFGIRSSSCDYVLEGNISDRASPIDDDLIKRAGSCMPKLASMREGPSHFNEKDITESERAVNMRFFEPYQRLLLLNGYIKDPSELKFKSGAFPLLFDLRSREVVIPTNTTSSASKFSPRIDFLRLYPGSEKINDNWIQDCVNFTDFTPLHIAVFKKDEKVIEEILSHISKNKLIQEKDANNLTALHWAVILGDSNIVKAVLNQIKREDRLSALNMQDNRGWSVFKWAIANQNEDLIITIISFLEAADRSLLVTNIDQYKRSYIHYAIETGNNKIVELLLEQILFEKDKSDVALIEDFAGQNLFDLGVDSLDAETFEILLLQLLPNKFARSMALQKLDNLNQTLLHKAAIRSDVDILKVIMRNILSEDKQRFLHIQDGDGKTALHLTMLHGMSEECISFLLDEVDLEYLKSYVMMRDKTGKPALHYFYSEQGSCNKLLCLFGKVKSCLKDKFTYKQDIIDILCEYDNAGRSLLHYAALEGNVTLVRMIFNECDSVNKENLKLDLLTLPDSLGKTPLHYLLSMQKEAIDKISVGKYTDLFEELLRIIPGEYMAYFLNTKDIHGKTPFYYSTMFFQYDIRIALTLLNKIPKHNRKAILETSLDEGGNTLFHYLASNKQEELLIEILKYVDINERKYLLELENADKISVIVTIKAYAILEKNLKELLALFSEDQDFVGMLKKNLLESSIR